MGQRDIKTREGSAFVETEKFWVRQLRKFDALGPRYAYARRLTWFILRLSWYLLGILVLLFILVVIVAGAIAPF
ncbi:MAG TPA: hypothetical protein H9902_15175 [Candidatus Stackebrandtia faecavium]|nr:hypothetical protein [Candidatus Stackebrandtia faecavium]